MNKRKGGSTPPNENNWNQLNFAKLENDFQHEESNDIEKIIDAIPPDLYDSLTNEEYRQILSFLQSKETLPEGIHSSFEKLSRPFDMNQFQQLVNQRIQQEKKSEKTIKRKKRKNTKKNKQRTKRKTKRRTTRSLH